MGIRTEVNGMQLLALPVGPATRTVVAPTRIGIGVRPERVWAAPGDLATRGVGGSTGVRTVVLHSKSWATSINSATECGGSSQCGVLLCGSEGARGAAASRLLCRFTLDPLSGYTAVSRSRSVAFGDLYTPVFAK